MSASLSTLRGIFIYIYVLNTWSDVTTGAHKDMQTAGLCQDTKLRLPVQDYCKAHAQEDMVYHSAGSKCQYRGCGTPGTFNLISARRGSFCSRHKEMGLDGMGWDGMEITLQ